MEEEEEEESFLEEEIFSLDRYYCIKNQIDISELLLSPAALINTLNYAYNFFHSRIGYVN